MKKKEMERQEAQKEAALRRLRLPKKEELEQFGLITQLLGSNKVRVICEDGQERNCRIPGKMKKRVWMREHDIVIVKLWDFQPSKADVVWRFTEVQSNHLQKRGFLTKLPY